MHFAPATGDRSEVLVSDRAGIDGVITRYRWWICGLLFFSTTINYVDRQLFANLIPYFEDELRIGPMDLAYINVAFLLTYGLGMTLVGRFVDRVGVRVGLALTFLLWNIASAGHALVYSVAGFILIRMLLGLGEAGNFPSSIKAVAAWFPQRERALATGWFNCGSNIGAVVTPLLVPIVATKFGLGWRGCFATLGAVGIVWLAFWLRMYRRPEEHRHVSPGELAIIQSDPPDQVGSVSVLHLLSQRQVYGSSLARFFTEAPWWFYLTWMPKFLGDKFALTDVERGWSVAIIYLIADFGAVGGGWISSRLIKRGRSVNYSRKVALLISALCTVPIISVGWLEGVHFGSLSAVWVAVPIVALAASAHQAWSSNMYTIVSDTLPKSAIATTIGINMAFGSVGSSMFQFLIAMWLVKTGNYVLPFILAGSLYLVGLLVLHLLMPRLEPAKIDLERRPRLRAWHVGLAAAVLAAALVTLQVELNKPTYRSMPDYYAKRQAALGAAAYAEGPTAKVGWQDARWIHWTAADGTARWELIKLDRYGIPFIEGKGTAAGKYTGPDAAALSTWSPR